MSAKQMREQMTHNADMELHVAYERVPWNRLVVAPGETEPRKNLFSIGGLGSLSSAILE
jgi:Ni,Fe-hydrogenase III small subunit